MPNIIFALLLSVGARALAFPTHNISTRVDNLSSTPDPKITHAPMEERGRFGWISTYAPGDNTCSHGYLSGFRPEVHVSCLTFEDPNGINDYVGINWRGAPLGFTGLQGFSDQHCKNAVGGQILMGGANNSDWRGANTCVHIADYGGSWGSVEGLGVYLADSG